MEGEIKVAVVPDAEGTPAVEQTPTETQPQITEQTTTEQTSTQTEKQPEWKSRFKSEDEMWEYAKQKQSEADASRAKLDRLQREIAPPAQPPQLSEQELLDQFVKDPKGFFQSMLMPIQAQIAMQDFSRSHPDFDSLRAEMAEVVNRNPNILADPEGLEMVYNHVKTRRQSVASVAAAEAIAQQRTETENVKKNSAWVEGSTKTQKSPALEIKPGMSQAEMDTILDKKGIGWVTRDH